MKFSIFYSVMELFWHIVGLVAKKPKYGSVFYSYGPYEKFEHKKSGALCVGIDQQYDEECSVKSLGKIAARDARHMGKALETSMEFNHVKVCISSEVSSAEQCDCTKRGINELFVKSAKAVEEGGIFIFYFAGHGVMVRNRCVLAPADFAGRKDLDSGISGNELIEWLRVADCKARYVLVILDCYYAGDLGTALISLDNLLRIKPGLFIMCACRAEEICTTVDALKHSTLTFFFLDYLERYNCKGQFDVKQAMNYISIMCHSFSSLLVSYNDESNKLQPREMHPTLSCSLQDYCDADNNDIVSQFYEQNDSEPSPHPEIEKWLQSDSVQEALHTLYSKAAITEALQKGILSSLLYSAASIQYAHDEKDLGNRNLFLATVNTVLKTIRSAHPKVNTTIGHLIAGLEHYKPANKRVNSVKTKPLDDLQVELEMYEKKARAEVDGPGMEPNMSSKVNYI